MVGETAPIQGLAPFFLGNPDYFFIS